MDLQDYLRVLRKRWLLVVLSALLVTGATAIVTSRETPQYRSTVGFFVSTSDRALDSSSNSAYTGGLFSQQRVKSYATIVSGPMIAQLVASDLRGRAVGTVLGHLTATTEPDAVLLFAVATDTSPTSALAIAESLARIFPAFIDTLENPTAKRASPVSVTVIQKPQLAGAPFSPTPVSNIGLALVLGLLFGVALAFLREALDNTVKNSVDILAATNSATLGVIVHDPNAGKRPLLINDDYQTARAEAFRQLRTNLQFLDIDHPLRSLTLTSTVPNEGKSTTACNLAITLSQAGVRTLLVEGDLRRPQIAEYLGMEGAIGLTSVLIGRVSLADALQPFGDGTLQVLASGPLPPNPSELLSSRAMCDLMMRLEEDFDVVLVDAPPLLPVTDAAVLGTLTDGAVLVVKCGSTRRDNLRRASETLSSVDSKLLGSILNMVPRRGPDSFSNYGQYIRKNQIYGANSRRTRMSGEDSERAIQSSR